MGFSFRSTGCVKRTKESWNEILTINESPARGKDERKTRRVETVGSVNALTVCVTRSAIDQNGSYSRLTNIPVPRAE